MTPDDEDILPLGSMLLEPKPECHNGKRSVRNGSDPRTTDSRTAMPHPKRRTVWTVSSTEFMFIYTAWCTSSMLFTRMAHELRLLDVSKMKVMDIFDIRK